MHLDERLGDIGRDRPRVLAAGLARAAAALNEDGPLSRALAAICREAANGFGADLGVINAADPHTHAVVAAAGHNIPPEAIGERLDPAVGVTGAAFSSGRPSFTNAYPAYERRYGSPEWDQVVSVIAVPLRWQAQTRGVLTLGFRHDAGLDDRAVAELEPFAELAAVACRTAIAQADLAHAARTDSLTGCLNHAAMHEALGREVERSARTGAALSLALIDLDGFKQINDDHGHLTGDEVLGRAGAALRGVVRGQDLVARYGGDEFAILAVEANEAEATDVAARAVERLPRATGAAVTGTAGVAQWESSLSPAELIARADAALLHGKRAGRRASVVRASEVPEAARTQGGRRPGAEVAAAPPPRLLPAADDQTARLRKRTRQLALANALSARLAAMADVQGILEATVEELHRAFGYFLCAVIRLRDDGYVEGAAVRGEYFERLGRQHWSQSAHVGVIGRCLRDLRPVVVRDVTADDDYNATPHTSEVRSELCVPLWVDGRLWGAINLEDVRAGAFDEDDARLVVSLADQVGGALRSAILFEQLDRAYLGTAEALAAALEAKDLYTADHSRSIVEHAEAVGRRLGLREEELRELRLGAVLHDIGKIAVPDAILTKPAALTPEERKVVERHTVVGEQILAPVAFLAGVLPLVRHQHERWDGGGYPDGLAGEAIPLGARIILACDAYDAMTTDRPYRAALSAQHAREELRRNAGTQFDPRVVEALLAVLDAPGAGPLGGRG